MAVAISPPTVSDKAASQTRAAAWTGISAAAALVATIPLVMMLQGPVTDILFVRGTTHNGSWGYASTLLFILLAPATYALFFGTAGELLKTRVSEQVHKITMRVGAVGMLPYVVMVTAGVYWKSGPQQSLFMAAAMSIPIAMVATIWASTQNH